MDVKTAICNRRSIRRFQNIPVAESVLTNLVDLSRMYASGANLQPIRYLAVAKPDYLDRVFETLRWAAYLPGFEIREDQRPMAYVILTADGRVKKNCQFDLGAAATTLMLAAEGEGLGSCCLGSFESKKLVSLFELSEWEEPLLVIALGYPDQKSRAVALKDSVKYFEDDDGCLCVPKRMLEDIAKMF
jgi:nitroreductase